MKKLMAVLLALTVFVGSASAVEFSIGGKAGAGFAYSHEYSNSNGYTFGSTLVYGADLSVLVGINFVDFADGKAKIGIRPEIGGLLQIPKIGFFSDMRLPVTFTYALNDTFSLGAGVGIGLFDIVDLGLTSDVFALFKAGSGNILVDFSYDLGLINFDEYGKTDHFSLGVGYLYTF